MLDDPKGYAFLEDFQERMNRQAKETLGRDVSDISEASSKLQNLRPVSFIYRDDVSGIQQYGLIAEEVAQVMPELVQFAADGTPQTVRYHFLPALMLNEIQKHRETIDKQGAQIRSLESRLAALERVEPKE